MTGASGRVSSLVRLLSSLARNPFSAEHPEPVFVLGHQKSGTTALAALLAELTDRTVTLDLLREAVWPSYPALDDGSMSFERFVARNRHDLGRGVVKEPQLTLYLEELRERFPRARFAYVVRDPRDNLRSLLDRLGVRGSEPEQLRRLEQLRGRNRRAWRLAFDARALGVETDHPLEVLAHRWNAFADVYLERPDDMPIVRYEDFRRDRIGVTRELAAAVGLEVAGEPADPDRAYQPRGQHRGVDPLEFFGADGVRLIERICGARMLELGYEPHLLEGA